MINQLNNAIPSYKRTWRHPSSTGDYSRSFSPNCSPANLDTVAINNKIASFDRNLIEFSGNKKKRKELELAIRTHFETKGINEIETIMPVIRNWLKLRLSPERYHHSISTETTARKIARILGIKEDKPALAALLHDNAKELPQDKHLKIKDKWINTSKISDENNIEGNHGLSGALIAENKLGIKDLDILNAIKYHNTKRSNASNTEMIVHLSDRIEPELRNRSFFKKIIHMLENKLNIFPAMKKVD